MRLQIPSQSYANLGHSKYLAISHDSRCQSSKNLHPSPCPQLHEPLQSGENHQVQTWFGKCRQVMCSILQVFIHIIYTYELCPKGPVLLKAIRICLRVCLRLAYATTVSAYARDFVEFALTRSLRLQVFAPHHSASLRAAIFTSRMPWSWNLRQASDAVEVDEDEEVQKEGRISHRRTMSLQKVRHYLHNFPLAARHYFREASFFGRHCGLLLHSEKECGLTRTLRAAYAELTRISGVNLCLILTYNKNRNYVVGTPALWPWLIKKMARGATIPPTQKAARSLMRITWQTFSCDM